MEKFLLHSWPSDIEAYIRDVKEAAHQLNYNDEAILHLIKATLPSEIYGTLYNQHDLNTVITMVKDIYARKPETTNPSQASGGATAPFTLVKAPNVREEEGEVDLLGKEEVAPAATEVRDGRNLRANSEVQEVDSPVEEDSRGESLIKVLPPRDPEYRVKRRTEIRTDAITVISEVTLQLSAQRKARAKSQNPQRGRNLRIIPMLMVVRRNLSWLWPRPYPKPTRTP